MITAEELTDAYEAEIQSRGIPPHPDLREARLSLSAGVLERINRTVPQAVRDAPLEAWRRYPKPEDEAARGYFIAGVGFGASP